jgi:Signal peptidase, peptidase S26
MRTEHSTTPSLRELLASIKSRLQTSRITRCCIALVAFLLVWLALDVESLFSTFIGFITGLFCIVLLVLFTLAELIFLTRQRFRGQRHPLSQTDKTIFYFVLIPLCLIAKLYLHPHHRADFGYDFSRVSTNAMAPTLLQGDYVLTDTRAYRTVAPLVGDLVYVRYAGNDYIRRVRRVSPLTGFLLSADQPSGQDSENPQALDNVEVPRSAITGRITCVVFSPDLRRIGLTVSHALQ